MATYVQISRGELESWLETLPTKGKWQLKPNRVGMYLLPLSDTVAVQLSSTIGSRDDAMGRGKASMKLALVSFVTGQVLNRKAMGQGHFKRTTNWQQTWRKGFDRMKDAYMKSQGFYDALAGIKDRDRYEADILQSIEDFEGWQTNNILSDFHGKVDKGGILTVKQMQLLDKILAKGPEEKGSHTQPANIDENLLQKLRKIYVAARRLGDQWTMDFAESVGKAVKSGRIPTYKQEVVIEKKLQQYRLATIHKIAARYYNIRLLH